MGVLDRLTGIFGPVKAAPEGAYRDGPWHTNEGWLPHAWGQYINWWQMGYDPIGTHTSAMVEACVSAYAQTTAMCPFGHWRDLANGGRELVTTSALSRIQRAPNDYQTRSDFLLNLVRSLYLDGNAYALALRNERFEIASLHLMHPRHSYGQEHGGEVFYCLGGNNVIAARFEALELDPALLQGVPGRDVLHVKLQTPTTNVLKGETPLAAAALAVASTNAAMTQSAQFYANQSRPSGVLQSDLVMTEAQNDYLRKKWEEQSAGLAVGRVPILTNGLKFNPITVSPKDSQFAESMKMSDAQIAQVFRVPPAIVGAEGQPMASTEAAMSWWIAGGLGFCLNQVELAYDRTFGLDRFNGEYSELDSSILLRSAFKDRIDGLVKAVQGGVFSPNEARRLESMPAKKGGDEPRVQQQLVPLSFAIDPPAPPAPAAPPSAPAPAPDPDEDEPAPPKMTVTDWNRYFEGAQL